MINYLSSNLSVSIYQFDYTELNSIVSKTYIWNGQLIVFGAFYNYTDQDFTQLRLKDSSGSDILHSAGTHSNCYSIAFSGPNTAQTLYNLPISDMNSITFSWNIPSIGSGKLIAKLYYI